MTQPTQAIDTNATGKKPWTFIATVLVFTLIFVATPYRDSAASTKSHGDAGSNGQVASPLYIEATEAIKARDHRRLQAILKKAPLLAKSMPLDKHGRRSSLLTSAIYWEDVVSVRMLLKMGADPNGKEGVVPLDDAVIRLNTLPYDAPSEITSLRLYVPSESERIRQYMRQTQLTRARIILLLLDAGANHNVASSIGDKAPPNVFEALTMGLCDSIFHDAAVLALFRESGVVFKPDSNSETSFRQHILVNAANGMLNRDCVIYMYDR
ncbi:hypothetical protein [Parazoarcus communis]|uniref:Ankyrin repeat domain-containing protein n=1 Tax=Parazoarcus communis SWub3 = DSM 12120 TaxID=1121029 RepID=A0A323UYF8_9RHOO|nr:hypothetical protein [Parazoarcus communis]NMG69546.1 hypothetical protein [Parazoarcus communis SWub3 = DSM 12120]PZA17484.1 hypothetical protein DNK49_06385 [Azoarcus communis] [Parazoarcus communis SWub3 = DSM 12120]